MQDLQAQAEARRDVHWRMYRAHTWKANILSTVILLCTTGGGTSGLISLAAGGGAPAPAPGSFSLAPMGGGGGGGGAAAVLAPVLGYAATLFSGRVPTSLGWWAESGRAGGARRPRGHTHTPPPLPHALPQAGNPTPSPSPPPPAT